MEFTTKYITPDDFKLYFGIDLQATLKDDDNPSNKATAFLKRIEVDIATWLDYSFFQNIDEKYPSFTNYQKEEYQYALLEQAMYVFRNGDVGLDSGYEIEKGQVVSRNILKSIFIAPKAEMHLHNAGLMNRYL